MLLSRTRVRVADCCGIISIVCKETNFDFDVFERHVIILQAIDCDDVALMSSFGDFLLPCICIVLFVALKIYTQIRQ